MKDKVIKTEKLSKYEIANKILDSVWRKYDSRIVVKSFLLSRAENFFTYKVPKRT